MKGGAQEGNCEPETDLMDDNKPDEDPDKGKPRATVKQYVALTAQKVAVHLENLARARLVKHQRPFQTDAEIHQSYIQATSGGGGEPVDEMGDGPCGEGEASVQQSRVILP